MPVTQLFCKYAAAPPQPCYFYYAQANIIRSRQSDIKSFFFSTTRFVLGVLSAQGVGLMQHFRADFDVIFVTGGMGS